MRCHTVDYTMTVDEEVRMYRYALAPKDSTDYVCTVQSPHPVFRMTA